MPDCDSALNWKISSACDKPVEDGNNLWKVQENPEGNSATDVHDAHRPVNLSRILDQHAAKKTLAIALRRTRKENPKPGERTYDRLLSLPSPPQIILRDYQGIADARWLAMQYLFRLCYFTHAPRANHSSTTGFLSVPTPSTLTSITSPATTGPTPLGVPVAIKSPGCSVITSAI